MSRFNLILFAKLLGLALNLITRILGYVATIRDLLDDGILNGSYEAPDWYSQLHDVIDLVDNLGRELSSLRNSVNETDIVE